jgi:hypothetical protein
LVIWRKGGSFASQSKVCATEHPKRSPARHGPASGEKNASQVKVHQLVRITHPRISDKRASASGIYEVTRLMPADQTGEVSYRI